MLTAMRHLSRILFYLSVYVCMPVILVVLTADVTLRYVFSSPFRWAQELATLLLFLSMVLALPESWLRGVHVRADFLQGVISERLGEVLARLKWAIVLAVSVIIIIQCWRDVELMTLFRERSPELGVPLHYLRIVLGFSALVLAAIALLRLVSLRSLVREIERDGL